MHEYDRLLNDRGILTKMYYGLFREIPSSEENASACTHESEIVRTPKIPVYVLPVYVKMRRNQGGLEFFQKR